MSAIIIGSAATVGCSQQKIAYPAAPSDTTVVDNYFGIEVKDPYRPLENDTSAATAAWVKAENEVTERYLSTIPYRDNLRKRLTELNDYAKQGIPWRGNDGLWYFSKNDGLKNQSVIYRAATPHGYDAELFLDPNTLSDDGTVALTGLTQSKDGRYTAYTISRSGSDWTEIYVMDTKSKQLLDDHIEWAKFTDAAWFGDGFYYSAYPRPEAGKEFSNANAGHQVYYHTMGTPQSSDRLVFDDPAHPLHFHTAQVTETEPVLFVHDSGEGNGNGIRMKNLLSSANDWIIVEPTQDYESSIIDVVGGKIYILTSFGAPNRRIMVADVKNPARENWKALVPERKEVLKGAQFAGDKLLLTYEKDASDMVVIMSADGKQADTMELPALGSVSLSSDRKGPEILYSLTSFTSPATVYAYDTDSRISEILFTPEIKNFNPDDYVTEQVFYPSADGTRIPMFLTYKKGLKRDGSNPVYLYGYGGFNISLTPSFSANRLLWLENGGIYAQTNLRGGSEYGETWHQAGTKLNKLNVFNDFIAAAEYMIKEGWTSKENIAIEGGSNGGLLVGAVTNMRPDLFKVAIPRVGVMDMMRYHLFTIGWNWAPDYGTSADSREMAEYLRAYSPAHNVRNDGTPYPAILVTTADHDDRVVPAHSFKYAAALQAADTGDAPKLIRIDSKAGHGAGKPMSKVIDEYADIYSFIFHNIGKEPRKY